MSPLKFLKKKNKNTEVESPVPNQAPVKPRNRNTHVIRTVSDARKWVSDLPLTDMGEVTRRLLIAITNMNQSSISPQVRIDISEVLLPYVKMVLENLDRHFLCRSFPLPERSQKIFELKKALLLETAGSYQLSALDMITNNSVTKKVLLLAIGRAISYMSQVLMNSYEIYAKSEKSVWHDIHHLYLLACEHNIQHTVIPNKDDVRSHEYSIEEYYKLINLVALAAPNTLRQGEVTKVSDFFKQVLGNVSIISDPDKVKSKYAHIALLNSDEPANLMPLSDMVNSPTSRIFDLSKVINSIDQFITLSEQSDLGTHEDWPMLTHSLAKRLAYVLTTIRNRRFKRFPRDEKAMLAIRMVDVLEMIRDNDVDSFYDQINEDVEDDNIYEALAEGDSVSSPWTDLDIESMAEDRDVKVYSWQIENSSSGGYGLCQVKLESSTARVGELVAIKDPKDVTDSWQIAVIRWMDSFKDVGLRIGLELLSLHAMTVKVEQIHNRDISQKLPVEGILLPTIDGAREEANLIFPGFIFKVDDELSITMGARQQNISLTTIDDTVGNFSYCGFEAHEKEEINGEPLDAFDDIWEFL